MLFVLEAHKSRILRCTLDRKLFIIFFFNIDVRRNRITVGNFANFQIFTLFALFATLHLCNETVKAESSVDFDLFLSRCLTVKWSICLKWRNLILEKKRAFCRKTVANNRIFF